jgi:soluble lytic murein transglycosylase-like protein
MDKIFAFALIVSAVLYLKKYALAEDISDSSTAISMTATEKLVMSFADLIYAEGTRQGMDPAAIAAVIHQESGGKPFAKRDEKDKSGNIWSTSYGLMQILNITASWLKQRYPNLKYDGNVSKLYDTTVNIEIGTKYLRYQYERYNHLKFAFAGYHAGSCMSLVNGKVKTCNNGTSLYGPFVNSAGVNNVDGYVTSVSILLERYRKIFAANYSNYDSVSMSRNYKL